MSWSLGETAALALKAARGAGMSWGLAEETAASVVWLHSRGLPGISALCSYLGQYLGQAAAPHSPEGGCPIMTGCALIDGMMDVPETSSQTLDLGHVHAPLLLLPFVARLEPAITGGTRWVSKERSVSQRPTAGRATAFAAAAVARSASGTGRRSIPRWR